MIYTITLNPCIDYYITTDNFQLNALNQSYNSILTAGGKGINVSKMLTNLNMDNIALLSIGGDIGDMINKKLPKALKTYIFHNNGNSRLNIKIINKDNNITEISGTSPTMEAGTINDILLYLNNKLQKDDILVLSGSLPLGVPNNFYRIICEKLLIKNIKIVLDTRDNIKENLFNNFLIKPNLEEFQNLCKTKFNNINEIKAAALELICHMGVENIIISLDKHGALLINQNASYFGTTPQGNLINATGAGDGMIAGFIYAHIMNYNAPKSLQYAISCGSATAYSQDMGTYQLVESLLEKINIMEI